MISKGWLNELKRHTAPREEVIPSYSPKNDLSEIISFLNANLKKDETPTVSEAAETAETVTAESEVIDNAASEN